MRRINRAICRGGGLKPHTDYMRTERAQSRRALAGGRTQKVECAQATEALASGVGSQGPRLAPSGLRAPLSLSKVSPGVSWVKVAAHVS